MKEYIFFNFQIGQEILFGRGNLIFFTIGGMLSIASTVLIQNFCKKYQWLVSWKSKQLWGILIRPVIQTCLPTWILLFNKFVSLEELTGFDYVLEGYKFLLMFLVPVWSMWFLRKNLHQLSDPDFKQKFGALYTNLYIKGSILQKFFLYFCLRRFLIAGSTVYSNKFILIPIFVYGYTALTFSSMVINSRPF